MNKSKLIFGGIGALGVLAFLLTSAVAMALHDSFSPLNSFAGELGKYPSGYLGTSPALVFNIALVASGLLAAVFFVGWGLDKVSILDTAVSFFWILTGVLIAAQGVFTLNSVSAHYIFTTLLFASAFIAGALFIVSSLLPGGSGNAGLAGVLLSFAAAAVSAVFAVFVQIGNMPYLLGVAFDTRIKVIPFAIVEWAALLLIFAFIAFLAVKMMLASTREEGEVGKTVYNRKKKTTERNLDF